MKRPMVILCSCGLAEHQIIFVDEDADLDCFYLTFHLTPLPLLRRIVYAVSYVFGHRSKYGAFDEMVIDVGGAQLIEYWVRQWLDTHAAGMLEEKGG